MLSPSEFAAKMVGIPWRKWRSDFRACDCFGLIVLWFRHVVGIELGPVPHTDIANGFSQAAGWLESPPEAGATCWMAWRDGAPTHCGILLTADSVLHAEGGEEHPGSVRVSRLRAVELVYGQIRFYRYTAC
ncbi:NlpC/P60 family protein [Xylophilus sp. GOD-11R]|uniref:NlpC/P60 family protein n=1 Tax=Xylophilus sp. GOD-11R TaxID=3089814 RepID=UPI00298C829B|nr:NlpC/P60 family protein [Xylophilus sp. GOD-11R]WPB58649.1 NlpC/P60 family protein [Xylophilus sp. GOD-11R]